MRCLDIGLILFAEVDICYRQDRDGIRRITVADGGQKRPADAAFERVAPPDV